MYLHLQAKIVMYSKFERQQDLRDYNNRHGFYAGPNYIMPTEPLEGARKVVWNPDTGLPTYQEKNPAPPEEETRAPPEAALPPIDPNAGAEEEVAVAEEW